MLISRLKIQKIIVNFKEFIRKTFCCKKGKWFEDIDWSNVSEEKTNIAYDNSILYLKDLEEAQKSLDSKAMVFLSYLFIIFGAILYNLFFNFDKVNKIIFKQGTNSYDVMLILVIGYSLLFGLTAMIFLATQKRKAKYGKPSSIFGSSNNLSQYIKNDLCIGLQESIAYNIKKQNRKSKALKVLLLLSVIFPICIISIYLFQISLFITTIMTVISYLVLWFSFQVFP